MEFDAIIIGAGTAGSVAALNLAPFRRVLLLEANAAPAWRIGESLPGAARRLLSDMGLLDAFVRAGHLPRHALRSAWGGAEPEIREVAPVSEPDSWAITRSTGPPGANCTTTNATTMIPNRVGIINKMRRMM